MYDENVQIMPVFPFFIDQMYKYDLTSPVHIKQ